MPTFEISLDDGRKFHVEADNAEAAHAGIQHVLGQGPTSQGGGVLDAAKQGASGLLSGLGETGQRYLGAGQALKDAGSAIAPKNQADTTLYDDKGFHAENIPNALAASSPSVAAGLAAARLMPGPLLAKLAAGGAVGLGSMAGNYAKEATAKRTGDANAPSSPEDLTEGLKRGVPEAALQSLPMAGLLGGPVAKLGLKGLGGSALRAVGDAGAFGAGNAASDVYDQSYQNGTVDPNQAINAGLQGGLVGGAFGAGRTLQDAKAAIKYRGISSEDPAHIGEASNRIIESNENLGGNLSNPQHGGDAVKAAQTDVATEFKAAINALKGTGNKNAPPLSQDAQNVLARAQAGLPISDADAATLRSSTGNSGAVDDLQRLSGVQRVLKGVTNTGYTNESGALTGGISAEMAHHIRALVNPVGAAAGVGLASLGGAHLGDMFAHSPEALTALGGAYGLARFSDWASGNRSPAAAFANRFADGSGVPLPQGSNQPQPNGPQPPVAPNAPGGGGPGLAALHALVAGQQPAAPPFNAAAMKPAVQAVLKARMNALKMQDAQPAAPAADAAAPPEPAFNASGLSKQVASVMKARQWADQMRQQSEEAQQPPAPAEAPPAPPVDLSALKGPVQAAIKARMNALAMQNAQQSPAEPTSPAAAPAPPVDLAGLKGAVRDALKARMHVLDMQNKQTAPAPMGAEEIPAFLPKRGVAQALAPLAPQEAPQAASAQAPSAPVVAPATPDVKALVPVVTKLIKSKGVLKQKIEQKPAPAEAPQAPQAVPPEQAAQAVPPVAAPQFAPGAGVEDGIPAFLRRAVQPAAPVAPPAPQVQVAAKALAKLNGAKPVEKAATTHELNMTPHEYAEHAMKGMFVRQGFEQQAHAAIVQREEWKRETAKQLAAITGQKEPVLFKKLREAQYRKPVAELRDFLIKKHPDDAETITKLLSDEELRKVWKYGAPKQ